MFGMFALTMIGHHWHRAKQSAWSSWHQSSRWCHFGTCTNGCLAGPSLAVDHACVRLCFDDHNRHHDGRNRHCADVLSTNAGSGSRHAHLSARLLARRTHPPHVTHGHQMLFFVHAKVPSVPPAHEAPVLNFACVAPWPCMVCVVQQHLRGLRWPLEMAGFLSVDYRLKVHARAHVFQKRPSARVLGRSRKTTWTPRSSLHMG